MLRWYLIRTKPYGESSAQVNLERQKYEVYFPRLLEPVRFGGRSRERIAALFPRYVFLRVDEGRQSLGPVRSTMGVANIVRFGFSYAAVPDNVVRELRERADPHSGLHRLDDSSPFYRGVTVRIAAGLFDGLEGVFERRDGAERVLVLLRILGQEAAVRIPAGFVLPALSA
jgi:transcriptional antiterminator RfaH